jgi:hypothetical protein
MIRRPSIPADHPSVIAAKKMFADKSMPMADICTTLRFLKTTFYRHVARS